MIFIILNVHNMFYHNYKKCYVLNKFLLKNKKNINNINKELYLSYNQLQLIPPEIGQLAMLQTLYLYNNQLQSIPPEIGQLAYVTNTLFV